MNARAAKLTLGLLQKAADDLGFSNSIVTGDKAAISKWVAWQAR